jgi:hypothetical protein
MRWIIYTALILASGCSFSIPDARFGCDDDSDCPSAHRCEANRCKAGVAAPVDGGDDGGDDGGVDDGGVDDGGVDDGGDDGGDAAAVETTCSMEMTALKLPEPSEVIGFDLDMIDNSEETGVAPGPTPAEGCGNTDLEGGVDNTLVIVLDILASVFEADFQGALDAAIENGSLAIVAIAENYAGPSSAGVTLTLVVNGESRPELTEAAAHVDEAGDIHASFSSLVLTIPDLDVEGTSIDFVIAMADVLVHVAAPTAPTTSMVIGGRCFYGDETSGSDVLRPQFLAMLDAAGDVGIEIEDLDSVLAPVLDLSSDGINCDSISVGVRATIQKVDCD